jgi:hypothetical protein
VEDFPLHPALQEIESLHLPSNFNTPRADGSP